MTTLGRSSVHILVSEGWNDDEELLEYHVEHPAGCNNNYDDYCYMEEDIASIDWVSEQYLRTPGRYGFREVYTRDYWGEHDADIELCDIPADMHTVREKMADQLALFGIKATTFGGSNLLDNLEEIVNAEVVDKVRTAAPRA